MITYRQWKLLNETMGSFNLGLSQKQNMGLVSSFRTGNAETPELEEGGMMPKYMGDEMPFKAKKKFPPKGFGKGDMGPDSLEGDEFDPDAEDIEGDEENIEGDEENLEGDEEDLEGDEEDLEGDEDLDIDPDAEMGDEEGDLDGLDNDVMDMPRHKSKRPMGNPHNAGPFMRFSRRMKAEGCDDEEEVIKKGKDGDEEGLLLDKKGKGKELAFLQKKSMKKKEGVLKMLKKLAEKNMRIAWQ